jgi:hypothetical protein
MNTVVARLRSDFLPERQLSSPYMVNMELEEIVVPV